ncbi:MAG: hypothetical protein ACOX6Q_02255 [Candidatus Dojkabacteria bacterium]|jgi:hypothetical protein
MENDFTNSNVERVELKQSSIKDEKINSRQQDKIIAVVESQNYSLLNERTVDVSAEQRENFLKKIVSGEVIDKDFYTVVEKVGGPEPEESFNSIYNNVLETSILQNCVRDLFPVGGKLSLDVLEEFKKRYPTPYEFENVSKDILSFIEKKEYWRIY